MKRFLPFGELAPDNAPLNATTLQIADGCVPIANGYAPIKQFAAESGLTLPAACMGAASFKSPDGSTWTFAGTSTNLYIRSPSAWTSVGSGYTTPETGWRFEQFGGLVVASNGVNAPQKFNTLGGSAFAALSGSPPRMRYLAVVRDFLVAGHLNDNGLLLQWSAINNAEGWTVTTDLSDYQAMPVGGNITGLAGGEYGIVFQEDRIVRMTFEQGPTVFRFDEISTNLGCRIPNSIVQEGRNIYFYSPRGFMVTDGSSVTPIGNERVDSYFNGLQNKLYHVNMSAAVDPVRKLIVWTVPDKAVPDKWLIYNYALNRWTTHTQAAEFILTGRTRDITIDEDVSGVTGDDVLDTADLPSLDSAAYMGGDPTFYMFNSSHAFGGLTGANAAATWGMGDLELVEGLRARLRRTMPYIDAASGLTLTMQGKARFGDALTTETYTSLRASGWMPSRSSWRTLRPKLAVAAGTTWTYAQGLAFEYEAGGER